MAVTSLLTHSQQLLHAFMQAAASTAPVCQWVRLQSSCTCNLSGEVTAGHKQAQHRTLEQHLCRQRRLWLWSRLRRATIAVSPAPEQLAPQTALGRILPTAGAPSQHPRMAGAPLLPLWMAAALSLPLRMM